ncbi:phage tail protein [Morganella psychrotolerans]|uniref:phage tail protein n=1 Tax=Morganella psychrotolerans TaxID=368603 RepID=UPI0039AFBB05
MTAKYFAILTNYGAAQLANAVALGTKLNISVMAVGDGGGVLPIPDPAQTKLIRETRRAAVNQVSVDDKNPNYIISEQVIPENEGGWFIREIGLFDDKGGLIAVGNAPETYKPNLQEGSGRTQVIQMVLMVSSTESITLKVDPSVVLATREYVTKSIAAAIQESEARAAKTYQPKGDYVLHPYLKLEMQKKLDKSDVVNQLGNDTSKAASQALVATELGKKAPLNVADGKLAKDKNGADIPDKPKFIENLGLGEAAKSKVLQTTGASKTDVMSQKSVTDELNNKANLVSDSEQSFNGVVSTKKEVAVRLDNKRTLLQAGGVIAFSQDNKTWYVATFQNKTGTVAYSSDLSDLADKNATEEQVFNSKIAAKEFNAVDGNNRNILKASGVITHSPDLSTWYDLVLPKKTGTAAITADAIGSGAHTWYDMTAQRKLNVIYSNTAGKPTEVSIYCKSVHVYVNSVRVAAAAIDSRCNISVIIPVGGSITVNSQGESGELIWWSELR